MNVVSAVGRRRRAPVTLIASIIFAVVASAIAPAAYGNVADATTNLVRNPTFTAPTAGGLPREWQAVGASGRFDPGRGRTSPGSGRLVRDEWGEGAWCQLVGVRLEPGARYILSGSVQGRSGDVAFAGIQLGGEPCTEPSQRIYRGLADDEWHTLSLEFTAPAGGVVSLWLGASFDRSVWWTDVSLRRAEELPERVARQWDELLQRYDRVYTGLVVDARGLNIERAMSPRILDDRGNLVYAGLGADIDWVIRHGIVAYMRDLAAAVEHRRLAVHEQFPYRFPLVVEAVGPVGSGPARDVVIRAHDADLIRRHLERYDFLARFAVVFLID